MCSSHCENMRHVKTAVSVKVPPVESAGNRNNMAVKIDSEIAIPWLGVVSIAPMTIRPEHASVATTLRTDTTGTFQIYGRHCIAAASFVWGETASAALLVCFCAVSPSGVVAVSPARWKWAWIVVRGEIARMVEVS